MATNKNIKTWPARTGSGGAVVWLGVVVAIAGIVGFVLRVTS